jgi:hypothetical protein
VPGELPFPIAFSYALIRAGRDPATRYERLLRCYEAVVRYCATVQLSDYVAAGCPDAELNRTLLLRLSRDLSLGHWAELTRQITALQRDGVLQAFMPEMTGFYFKPGRHGSLTPAAQVFESRLLSARNEWAHPDRTWGPETYSGNFQEQKPLLDGLLDALGFLAKYVLYVPYRGARPGVVSEAFRLMGQSEYPELRVGLDLVLAPAVREQLHYEMTAFLVAEDDPARQLLLHPLALFANRDGMEDIFWFDGLELRRNALRRISYRGVRMGQPPLEVVPGSDYERLVSDLGAMLTALGTGREPAPSPEPAEDLSSHYFAVQRAVLETHASGFVGRTYVAQAVDRFLERQPRGYLLIQGSPGQGKSAVASQLVKSRGALHHFISRSGGRTDPRLILRSLIAQLAAELSGGVRLPDSVAELAKLFEELLARLAGRAGRALLVIDALDELPDDAGQELPFLPVESLSRGCYLVVTARPGARLDRLRETLAAVPVENYELGPLDRMETRAILRARKPDIGESEVERIAEVSQGNPLYLKAVTDALESDPAFDLRSLPGEVEGFFRRSTAEAAESPILRSVLGLLAAARKPLSLRELGQVTGLPQREIHERGIRPVRQFLTELEGGYAFYHARFHEFVMGELLYADEITGHHRQLAEWLRRPESRSYDYRWKAQAHHLFAAGDREGLARDINRDFLAEKVRRFGYAVLEDVELLSRALIESEDPGLVEQSVGLIEALRDVVGGDVLEEAGRAVRTPGVIPGLRPRGPISPPLPGMPGLDVYVGLLPRVEVSADFFELVPRDGRLIAAIGDAPATGLKSAFVARFIANLFRRLVEESDPTDLVRVLHLLEGTIAAHEYFRRVTMLCAEVDPGRGRATLVSAGHPYPVLYSARRQRCDRLLLRGDALHAAVGGEARPSRFERRQVEVFPGDVLALVSDGLTEGHVLQGDPYGYRFTKLLERLGGQSARAIGEAILEDWSGHPREGDQSDDVTLILISLTQGPAARGARP